MALFCQIAAYVYAKFALKFGNMYRKGSKNSTLALAGISVIQKLHLVDKEGKEEEIREYIILQVITLFCSGAQP